MLFMGEEWGSTAPFYFFRDFQGELGQKVREGRNNQFCKYCGIDDQAELERLPDPIARATYEASRPDRQERETAYGQEWLAYTKKLLALRRQHITPNLRTICSAGARKLGERAVQASWIMSGDQILRISINLGNSKIELDHNTIPENIIFSSDCVENETLASNCILVEIIGSNS